MSESHLKISGTPDVRRVTLARPEVRNAFNAELIAELARTLEMLTEDSALRVLVLAAEGDAFCAGADFHWMKSQKDAGFEANLADAHRLFDLFHGLYSFPRPTIACVQGGAFGGGAGLVACADFAVLSEDTVLAFSEVRIGLVPATISPFVIRKIGAGRARELFLTGDRISAARALELGLAHKVVRTSLLDQAVEELASTLLRGGPESLAETKRLLGEVCLLPLDEARTVTADFIATRRISDEGQEGMAAFLEKRKPKWIP